MDGTWQYFGKVGKPRRPVRARVSSIHFLRTEVRLIVAERNFGPIRCSHRTNRRPGDDHTSGIRVGGTRRRYRFSHFHRRRFAGGAQRQPVRQDIVLARLSVHLHYRPHASAMGRFGRLGIVDCVCRHRGGCRRRRNELRQRNLAGSLRRASFSSAIDRAGHGSRLLFGLSRCKNLGASHALAGSGIGGSDFSHRVQHYHQTRMAPRHGAAHAPRRDSGKTSPGAGARDIQLSGIRKRDFARLGFSSSCARTRKCWDFEARLKLWARASRLCTYSRRRPDSQLGWARSPTLARS